MNNEFKQLERDIDHDLATLSDRLAVTPPAGLETRLRHSVHAELSHQVSVPVRRSGWVLWSAVAAAAAIALTTSIPLPQSAATLEAAEEWGLWAQALEDSQGTIATALDETAATDPWSEDDADIESYLESYDLWLGTGT